MEGTEVQIHLFLTLVLDGKSGTNFTLRPLCLRERKLLAIKQEAEWASENFSVHQGREKSLSPTGIRNSDLQDIV